MGKSDGFISHLKAAQINDDKRAPKSICQSHRMQIGVRVNHPAFAERIIKTIERVSAAWAAATPPLRRMPAQDRAELHKPKTGFPFNKRGATASCEKIRTRESRNVHRSAANQIPSNKAGYI